MKTKRARKPTRKGYSERKLRIKPLYRRWGFHKGR